MNHELEPDTPERDCGGDVAAEPHRRGDVARPGRRAVTEGAAILDDVAVAVLAPQPDAEGGGEGRLHHAAVG